MAVAVIDEVERAVRCARSTNGAVKPGLQLPLMTS